MAETFICSICHQEHPLEDCIPFDGRDLCPDCLRGRTCLCDYCNTRIWAEDDHGDSYIVLCEHCADTHYEPCASCGRLVESCDLRYPSDDSDEGYCAACYSRLESTGVIHDYYYKPAPIFYGEGTRYFGVELEIDGAGEYGNNASMIQDVANAYREHIYIKHDGSLDEGMEIVTHPMTLEYHLESMPWGDVIEKALKLGYTSHQANTCGLHVHVNRSSLGDTIEQQEDTIARILFFVETHWNELLRFSRRTRKQLERWSARYGRRDDPKEILDNAKSSNKGRYTCVNLTNTATIEFRIFRGTLKLNTLIATLQLVNRICDVAFYLSDSQLQDMTWTEFVSGISEGETPELVTYLKERRLYVNEPVVGSEEV